MHYLIRHPHIYRRGLYKRNWHSNNPKYKSITLASPQWMRWRLNQCCLCFNEMPFICQQECSPTIQTSVLFCDNWSSLLLGVTENLVNIGQSLPHVLVVRLICPYWWRVSCIAPTWSGNIHQTIENKIIKTLFCYQFVIERCADVIHVIDVNLWHPAP